VECKLLGNILWLEWLDEMGIPHFTQVEMDEEYQRQYTTGTKGREKQQQQQAETTTTTTTTFTDTVSALSPPSPPSPPSSNTSSSFLPTQLPIPPTQSSLTLSPFKPPPQLLKTNISISTSVKGIYIVILYLNYFIIPCIVNILIMVRYCTDNVSIPNQYHFVIVSIIFQYHNNNVSIS
jgi:hypothetical protein